MCRRTAALAKVIPVLIATFAWGCGQVPANVSVNPSELTLSSVDEAVALTAVVFDSKGEQIAQPKLEWVSSDPAVVTADATGKLTAKKSGEAVLTVTAGSVKKEVPVKVAIYSEMKLSESAVTMNVGEAKAVTVQLFDESKQPVAGAAVQWETDNESVAKVAEDGTITALTPGTATVIARTKTTKGQVTVTVAAPSPAALKADAEAVELAVGATQKVEIQALDAQSNQMQNVAVTWQSSDATKATVAQDGTISAMAAGEATVTATAGTTTAQIKVTVK